MRQTRKVFSHAQYPAGAKFQALESMPGKFNKGEQLTVAFFEPTGVSGYVWLQSFRTVGGTVDRVRRPFPIDKFCMSRFFTAAN